MKKKDQIELIVQNGHSKGVRSIAFSPDGKKILSGSEDNTIKLWDTSGKLLYTFVGHSNDVISVAFSPDGKQILSGSDDRTIKLWDISGKLLHTFKGHDFIAASVAFSPDGKQIVSGSYGTTIDLWDISGKLHHMFEGHSSAVFSVAFSPNGKQILSGSADSTIKLWDISGKLLHTFEGHYFGVKSVAFSPDGKHIISGSEDKTIKLWDTSGKLLNTIEGHSGLGGVKSVAFSPDGKYIVSAGYFGDKAIKLWDTSGKLLHTFEGHSSDVCNVAFSPDGKQILSGSADSTIKLWDISGKLLYTFEGHSNGFTSVDFSPDGKQILSGSADSTIKLWDFFGKLLHTFEGLSNGVTSVAFSPDGKQILSGSWDSTIKLWGLSGKMLHTFEGHLQEVTSVAISPDGKQILSGSADGTIKLWDISGTLLYTFKGHSNGVTRVAISPDGKQVLSSSKDNTIKLWDISGKLVHTFKGHSSEVESVAFSPDGKQILSGSMDHTIKLWDLFGKLIYTFEGHLSVVTSVAFSPDGKRILSGSWDNTIKLWDISGKLLHTFEGHSDWVNSVDFSHNGKFIVSGSSDTTIKLWDVEKRALVATLIAFKDGEGLVYTPDGKFDYTSAKVKDYVSYRKGNEFIDLSDMFDHFYEKGLLEKVLAGDADNDKQDTKSLDEKFKNRPLIKVRNIDPQKIIKAEEATRNLRFAVTDQGSGISEVMVFVNGRLLSSNWKDFSEDLKIDVPLVAGVNKVEIKAYNKDNIPITHSMELTREAALDEVLDKPDLYLLAVGINEYKESKLKFSVNDAKDFTSLIEKKSKGLFGNIIVKSLLDKDASKRNIKEAIADIKLKAKAKDVVMLYFSGHGNTAIKVNPLPNENPKLFYFVPSDFGWGDTNMDSESVARNQGVDADYINKSISSMLPHKVVLILDACQSGDVQLAMKSGDKTKLARHQMERLANGTGRFILTSSAGNELSREIASLGHGVFTYVLLQALEEADTDKSGDISLREIGRYIEDKFEEKTKPFLKDIIQSPSPLIQLGRDSASARVNDFPLVKTR